MPASDCDGRTSRIVVRPLSIVCWVISPFPQFSCGGNLAKHVQFCGDAKRKGLFKLPGKERVRVSVDESRKQRFASSIDFGNFTWIFHVGSDALNHTANDQHVNAGLLGFAVEHINTAKKHIAIPRKSWRLQSKKASDARTNNNSKHGFGPNLDFKAAEWTAFVLTAQIQPPEGALLFSNYKQTNQTLVNRMHYSFNSNTSSTLRPNTREIRSANASDGV